MYNYGNNKEVISLGRTCGILLPLSSLPGGWGIGDLGPESRRFVDFLSRSGQRIWQMLPLSETDGAMGNSPYSSSSAFAGSRLYISPDDLVERGLLTAEEIGAAPAFPSDRVDYRAVRRHRKRLLERAFSRFSPTRDYEEFLEAQSYWVFDYALFAAMKTRTEGSSWESWPDDLKKREIREMARARFFLTEEIDRALFEQFMFFESMKRLRRECDEKGVELLGDLPIYVNYDSADVWAHQEFFQLDQDLVPTRVAGVPPDYFSKTGQLWGNPLYDWEELERDNFSWWIRRLEHSLSLFHLVRIDHFRGLLGYWAVPYGDRTAERGEWRSARPEAFFGELRKSLPGRCFLAENLGVITPDVTETMERMDFPGMAVLQFGFSGDARDNPHAPHNYAANLAAYSGTHDNNTVMGWYREDATAAERLALAEYAGRTPADEEVPETMVRLVLSSVAELAVIPLQDHLGLGSEARINMPSTPSGNWEWRARKGHFSEELARRLKRLAEIYGRN